MRPALFVVAVLAVVIAASVRATAHDSHPIFYDSCTSLTIEGEIERPVVDLIQIRRASDGWNWARTEPTSQDCGRK
jgi:hypothetical protein